MKQPPSMDRRVSLERPHIRSQTIAKTRPALGVLVFVVNEPVVTVVPLEEAGTLC